MSGAPVAGERYTGGMTGTPLTRRADAISFQRTATVRPLTFDEARNTVEVCWTTGASVSRFDIFSGERFDETLEVTPRALRLDRLNDGAPVLDTHDMYQLGSVLGAVVPGSVRLDGGKGYARLALSDAPGVADTVEKVRAGHIRNLSVGYLVHIYERRAGGRGEPDELCAIDWEPTEISFVPVPADPGAQVRSDDMTRIVEGAPRVRTAPTSRNRAVGAGDRNRDDQGGGNQLDHADDDRDRDPVEDARRSERRGSGRATPRLATVDRIRDLCGRSDDVSRVFERQLIEDHMEQPLTERQLSERLADELIRVRTRPSVNACAPRHYDDEPGSPGQLATRMGDALYARMSGNAPTEQGREFMGASMVDMMRGLMESRGERVRWSSPASLVDGMSRSSAHTTSDFPMILGNAVARYLGDLIAADPSPLRVLARQRLANDFRRMNILKIGGNPALLVVAENGEFKSGSAVEWSEGYALNTYGRIFGISRQAIINDDLGAFVRIFEGWGRSATNLEADLLASIVRGDGLQMADGKPLYHADHGNLAATGTAITVASLSDARQAMRTQKDIDGITPLNLVPKYLVVGAAQETAAEQVLADLAAATPSGVNPFSGKLELIVDGRLLGYSWRLFASPAQSAVIEEARLAGQEDVFVDTKVGFEVDGIQTKARLDIAAAAVDWRGAYLNPGAAPA